MAKVFFHMYKKNGKIGAYLTDKPQPPGIRAESSLEIEVDDKLVEHNFGLFIDKMENPAGTAGQWLDNAKMEDFVQKMEERDDEIEKAGKDPETGKSGGNKPKILGIWKALDDNTMQTIEPMIANLIKALDEMSQENPADAHLAGAIKYIKAKLRPGHLQDKKSHIEVMVKESTEEQPEASNDEQTYEKLMEALRVNLLKPLEELATTLEDEAQKKAVLTLQKNLDEHFTQQIQGYFDLETAPEESWGGDDTAKKTEPEQAKKVDAMVDAGKSSEEIASTIKPVETKPIPTASKAPEQVKPATATAPEQNKPAESKVMQKAKSMAPKMEKEMQDRINELPEEDRQYALELMKNVMGVLK